MSVHMIYKQNGVKMMRPVHNRAEYLKLRNDGFQKENVARIRQGDGALKASLVQMNYSCLPNEDGSLKGSKRLSPEEKQAWLNERMAQVPELVLSKKDELGLQMLERSATKGYHLVFSRRPELSQEENLKWASELLGVEFDKGAKDITRVFFTTTEAEMIFLDDGIFEVSAAPEAAPEVNHRGQVHDSMQNHGTSPHGSQNHEASPHVSQFPTHYHGIPFTDIIAKYWELNNHGFEPTQGDRDTLTYQLACDLRHICARNFECGGEACED